MSGDAPSVVVFGYDELVLAATDVVRRCGGCIVAVVFPSVRRDDARVRRVRSAVEAAGWPVVEQPPRADSVDFTAHLSSLAPDLFVVWSYPMILPPQVLAVPRLGSLNLHMGLLPEYRGPSALQWTVANGETVTGATLHYMDEGVDTGPMLAQARVPIGSDDDITDVLRSVRDAGLRLLNEGWPHFSARRLPAREQDEARACYWPRWTSEQGRIDWSANADSIHNLVRATAAPFQGAHTTLRDRRIVIRKSIVADAGSESPPGRIVAVDPAGIRVATGLADLLVTWLEVDGASMSSEVFAAREELAGQSFV